MLDVADAQARIVAAFNSLPAETVPLRSAHGRVLAAPVAASRDQPPGAVSAMDGYAVCASDAVPGHWLSVIGTIAAGQPSGPPLGPGEAVRIFTGALVPEGADAILIQEDATVASGPDGQDRIQTSEPVAPGLFIREQGLDYRAGWVGLEAGTRLGPLAIGLAASLGKAWLEVSRQPRVGVIGTGDELVLPGCEPARHQITSSNSFLLAAMLEGWGAEPVDLGIAADAPEALAARLEAARGLDLLVTSGGASVGDHDLVRRVGDAAGLSLDFWKIRMRPGKPLIFGRLGPMPLIGLPGNPVSAAVCGIVFVRGAVHRMLGLDPALPERQARLSRPLDAGGERQEYLRGRLTAARIVEIAARQDSSMLATLASADVLVVRPPRAPALPTGADVTVIMLSDVI